MIHQSQDGVNLGINLWSSEDWSLELLLANLQGLGPVLILIPAHSMKLVGMLICYLKIRSISVPDFVQRVIGAITMSFSID